MRQPAETTRRVLLAGALLAAQPSLGATPLQEEPPPEVDPYTRGDPAAMRKAGYASFGPFLWGEGHTTDEVEEVVGGAPILWVETDHFRIGCGLETYELTADPDERGKLRAELKLLKKRLPRVKTSPKELDPWLRLHLLAFRLETLWSEFLDALELEPDDWLATGQVAADDGVQVGGGEFLGASSKFRVLVLQKESGLERYARTYLGRGGLAAYYHYFPRLDTFFLGTSSELLKGPYATDTGLHCTMTFWQTKVFLGAFRAFTHYPPLWWSEGVSRWFMRRVDPTYMLFCSGDLPPPGEEDADWEPKVRARVRHEHYPPTSEMVRWADTESLAFADHLFPWSRVDYLLQRGDGTARALLMAFKEPIPLDPERRPTDEELRERHAAAFESIVGMSCERFDEVWSKWVEREYRSK